MKALSTIVRENSEPTLLNQPLIDAYQRSGELSGIIRLERIPRGCKQNRRFHVNNLTRPTVIGKLLSGRRYAFVGSKATLIEFC